MNIIIPIILTLALAAAMAVALRHYMRASCPAPVKVLMISLRFFALLLLAGLFFQPRFTFDYFAEKKMDIAVLVDNSKSMRLFRADSLFAALVPLPESSGIAASGTPYDFHYFCFGDSLRRAPSAAPCGFADTRSYLPLSTDDPLFKKSRRLVFFTDGNWSNAFLPSMIFEDKECFYVKLPPIRRKPYLTAETVSSRFESRSGDTTVVHLRIRGFFSRPDTLDLQCHRGSSLIARRKAAVDSGSCSDTLSIRIPANRIGRHVCRLTIVTAGDSLDVSLFFIQHVIPRQFTAFIHAPVPRLDNRFFSIALKGDSSWLLVRDIEQKSVDMPVFFDWDSLAAGIFDRLDRRGIAVFAGCVPGGKKRTSEGQSHTVIRPAVSAPTVPEPSWNALPPPDCFIVSDMPAYRETRRITEIAVQTSPTKTETFPLISFGRFKGRAIMILAARGFWRWDFLPQSLDTDTSGAAGFSRYLLALARDALLANLADTYLIFPRHTPLYAHAGIPLALAFPAENEHAGEKKVVITLAKPDGSPVFDTSFSPVSSGNALFTVRLPAQPPGIHLYHSTLSCDGKVHSFADTLTIEEDNTEYHALDQNTALLNQFARPIDPDDHSSFDALTGMPDDGHAPLTVTKIVQLKQTWPALLAVLLLLFAEWIVRRRYLLD